MRISDWSSTCALPISGERIEPLQAYSYSASKAAIHQLSRQLAADLADRNISVHAVRPGFFPTSMTAHLRNDEGTPKGAMAEHIPLRSLGRPADTAGIIVVLPSPPRPHVPGPAIPLHAGAPACRRTTT